MVDCRRVIGYEILDIVVRVRTKLASKVADKIVSELDIKARFEAMIAHSEGNVIDELGRLLVGKRSTLKVSASAELKCKVSRCCK